MDQNLYLAKSDPIKYPQKSCNTCKGYGLIHVKVSIKCKHCCKSEDPTKYSICCYCENTKNRGPYVECNICLGSGSPH